MHASFGAQPPIVSIDVPDGYRLYDDGCSQLECSQLAQMSASLPPPPPLPPVYHTHGEDDGVSEEEEVRREVTYRRSQPQSQQPVQVRRMPSSQMQMSALPRPPPPQDYHNTHQDDGDGDDENDRFSSGGEEEEEDDDDVRLRSRSQSQSQQPVQLLRLPSRTASQERGEDLYVRSQSQSQPMMQPVRRMPSHTSSQDSPPASPQSALVEQRTHHANQNRRHDDVITKIETIVSSIILDELNTNLPPTLTFPNTIKRLSNLQQSRSFANILLVLSFVHRLLLSNRTTTTREVFYFYVTHFRSQRECDAAIVDVTHLLNVPRVSLGIVASPKGWFCGCIRISRRGGNNSSSSPHTTTVIDGTSTPSAHGMPITREWLDYCTSSSTPPPFHLTTTAKCILVIEKEGVYNRLAEDQFFTEQYPSILITGKGFPDLATRALVHALHVTFPNLPIYGICDCNPFGVHVLMTYATGGSARRVLNRDDYAVPKIQWVGLRPSHVEDMSDDLPKDVYQSLTALDEKKLKSLQSETCTFIDSNAVYVEEVERMSELGYKVELEALHWLGMEYMAEWLGGLLRDLDDGETMTTTTGGGSGRVYAQESESDFKPSL